jgi:hypothetical protein
MIEVLKQALDALEYYGWHTDDCGRFGCDCGYDKAITSLRQAIAELESQNIKQVTVKDFVHMVEGKEDLIGRPVYFAQWPNGNTSPPQRTEQEQQIETLKLCLFQMQEAAKDLVEQAKSLPPPQRTWVGLMRGVRVEGDAVVIRVHGGNDEARALCGELINEMEKNT